MKTVLYTLAASNDLRMHRVGAKGIIEKVTLYAETGAGDVKPLVGRSGKRLRMGDYRGLFEEHAASIIVQAVGPRGAIYD